MFLKVRESKSPEDVQEIPQADDPLLGTAALCTPSGGASAESDFGFCEGVCMPSPTQAGMYQCALECAPESVNKSGMQSVNHILLAN